MSTITNELHLLSKFVFSLRNEVTSKDKRKKKEEETSQEENFLQALADLFWRLQHERSAVSTTEVTKALNITNG